jgi:hypothetical protein
MGTSDPSRPTIGMYFVFAWVVSAICEAGFFSAGFVSLNLDPDAGFSIRLAFLGLILAILKYGAGAFVLGTLTSGRVKTKTSVAIYVIPSFLLRGLIFASATVSEVMKEDLLANSGSLIVMPIIYLVISPFVSFWFIRRGENAAQEFSREKSVLNIPWQHWLWILPFYLFQVICVPTYLLLALWRIDSLIGNISLSFMSLPALIPRMIVFAILVGILCSISSVYSSLSEKHESFNGNRVLKVFGNWLLLTSVQVLIVVAYIGRHAE